MNMNVKLEGDDEQSIHYPNRAAIALQGGGAAYINLNIVNPNLTNQGYILNPVNTVPQNLVAYQSPVTLQSYITLQEADGNLVNNLQVGVPVPIGLPVPAELLQNPNLVNTSIIIGNEDCNQPVIFKPATNNISEPNNIKISYMPKPMMQDVKPVLPVDDQSMRLNDISGINIDSVLKKPCPLEMSIKAANIDLEFEKCDPEDLIPETNGLLQAHSNFPIIHKLPIQEHVPENVVLNVPVKIEEKPIVDVPVLPQPPPVPDARKKPKTEITWDSNSLHEHGGPNEFRESLICEVEEANEDEDDDDDADDDRPGSASSDDNETLPLSVVLKLRRVQEDEERGEKSKGNKKPRDASCRKFFRDEESLEPKKFLKVRHCCSKKECFKKISLKDQKTAHKNFWDLGTASKQDGYLMSCIEHVPTARSLGGEAVRDKDKVAEEKILLDAKNIQLEIENESNGNQMLSDEIQKAIKESLKDCGMVSQLSEGSCDVGTQAKDGKFSEEEDEVQEEEEGEEEEDEEEEEDDDDDDDDDDDAEEGEEAKDASDEEEEDGKMQNWNYYLAIDRCRKRVCLQFLLKLFRITKKRIKLLQEKILSGRSPSEDSLCHPFKLGSDKSGDVWECARMHLNSVQSTESPQCKSVPRHRFLGKEHSAESLLDKFKSFYAEKTGKELKLKLCAYKRFLTKDSNVCFSRCAQSSCSECDLLEEQEGKKKKRRRDKNAETQTAATAKLDRSFQARKKGRKKWETSTDSDCSSDNEPLVKRKKLKLTISLKGGKTQSAESADAKPKRKPQPSKDVKGRGNGVKGRDVWSLMLLHLETMPYKVCKSCVSRKRHRFFDAATSKQTLYEDYRRYFLKETNSELGLGFTMYEKYFDRNCGYTIGDVDVNSPVCPRCALEPPKADAGKSNKKNSKNYNNNVRSTRIEEIIM